jgi:predicted small secreted protein
MRSILLPFLVLFAFVFAACEGTTTGGSTGTDANGNITSVELHAEGSCTANEDDRVASAGRFAQTARLARSLR